METFKEKQIQEAVKRMQTLEILDNVIEEFRDHQIVNYSERMSSTFDGMLYWLHNHDEFVRVKDELEKERGCLVYHGQLTHTTFGDMLTLLYVSGKESEWKAEERAIKKGEPIAYVHNFGMDAGETGTVGIAPCNGGITRKF